MSEVRNAQIVDTKLTMEEHGVLTYYLLLRISGGGVCTYGGYVLGHGYLDADDNFFKGSFIGTEAIMRIMNVAGVEKWEDLKEKYIRVVDEGWGKPIEVIGNIMDDKWFDQKAFFDQWTPKPEEAEPEPSVGLDLSDLSSADVGEDDIRDENTDDVEG